MVSFFLRRCIARANAYTFTVAIQTRDRLWVDRITDVIFSSKHPHLKPLQKYFIQFGWREPSFLHSLQSLSSEDVSNLVDEIRLLDPEAFSVQDTLLIKRCLKNFIGV